MKSNRDIERLLTQEFKNVMPNLIWQNEHGQYEVFGKYKIIPVTHGYQVTCSATDIGVFSSTRTALSWCIADKHSAYNTAREIQRTDAKIAALKNDITVRAAVGDHSRDPIFRETILTKLENKIIQKKLLENHLTKYVNWAKYCQLRGFENETARTGRGQPNKTSR
jgi:hypothetical protein